MIDLSIFLRVAESVAAAVLGAFALRLFERRPRLVAFYGHVGEFRLQPTGGFSGGTVHTHSVVIRNSGKLTAHNVRLPHNLPPAPPLNVSVFPQTAYSPNHLPGGGEEIVFPVLVPGQQVTISYLYFPPLTFNQINLPISSDEGMARSLNVLPTPQLRSWQLYLLWALVGVGSVTTIYVLIEIGRWFVSRI